MIWNSRRIYTNMYSIPVFNTTIDSFCLFKKLCPARGQNHIFVHGNSAGWWRGKSFFFSYIFHRSLLIPRNTVVFVLGFGFGILRRNSTDPTKKNEQKTLRHVRRKLWFLLPQRSFLSERRRRPSPPSPPWPLFCQDKAFLEQKHHINCSNTTVGVRKCICGPKATINQPTAQFFCCVHCIEV